MDASGLEKRLIYLRGVAAGILQGASPNVSRFKYQIDYEISMLEKQIQAQAQAQTLSPTPTTHPSPKSMVIKEPSVPASYPALHISPRKDGISNMNVTMIQDPVDGSSPTPAPTSAPTPVLGQMLERDYQQLEEIARKITHLKELLLQNNNMMRSVGKNRSYNMNVRLQGMSKKSAELMSSIHNTQIIYDMIKHKIQQTQEQTLKAAVQARKEEPKPKSILKKNIQIKYEKETDANHPTQRRIQINTDRNTVAEIPSQSSIKSSYGVNPPSSPIQADTPLRRLVRRDPGASPSERANATVSSSSSSFVQKILEKEDRERNHASSSSSSDSATDKQMLEEFQNTIGSLQRLLL